MKKKINIWQINLKKGQKRGKIIRNIKKKCRKIFCKKKNFLRRRDSNPQPLARDTVSSTDTRCDIAKNRSNNFEKTVSRIWKIRKIR